MPSRTIWSCDKIGLRSSSFGASPTEIDCHDDRLLIIAADDHFLSGLRNRTAQLRIHIIWFDRIVSDFQSQLIFSRREVLNYEMIAGVDLKRSDVAARAIHS